MKLAINYFLQDETLPNGGIYKSIMSNSEYEFDSTNDEVIEVIETLLQSYSNKDCWFEQTGNENYELDLSCSYLPSEEEDAKELATEILAALEEILKDYRV